MLDRVRRRQDYARVFRGEAGGRVLRDLMRRHFVLRSTQAVGDSHESAFNEGRRAVVLDVLHTLRVREDELIRQSLEGDGNE
ncbi:MAG: hypothetical protein HKM95_07990 [Inquilinus sp.]|nr:hypothetical protein [Inquilinus sp.]